MKALIVKLIGVFLIVTFGMAFAMNEDYYANQSQLGGQPTLKPVAGNTNAGSQLQSRVYIQTLGGDDD
ncbi:MAG: hypothetical protein ACO2ZM_04495 [Francisellaceae bacterium]